jgi:uncharacterized protein YndB with AHSA1/START domain
MARNERLIEAPAAAVFDVLADPRSYAYWVLGSMEIRGSDPSWPEVGSRFHHTVGLGPLRLRDHTFVEEVEQGRYLKLQARTRPFASARVELRLEQTEDGTRVTMVEDPADAQSAFVFMPLTHLMTRLRNARSLQRLAELAEGRRPIPGKEPGAPSQTQHGGRTVKNPRALARRATWAAMGRGAAAGVAGAVAMSVSTNVEMRVRSRPPSYAPARAIARVLGLSGGSERQQKLIGTAGHAATAVSVGVLRGLLDRAGLGSRSAGLGLFGIAMAPELVVVPALGATDPPWRWSRADAAVSVMHHAVFAAATSAAYETLGERS